MVYYYWGGGCHEVGVMKGREVGKNPHFQSLGPFAWLEATATHECAKDGSGDTEYTPHKRQNLAAVKFVRDVYGKFSSSPDQRREEVLAYLVNSSLAFSLGCSCEMT